MRHPLDMPEVRAEFDRWLAAALNRSGAGTVTLRLHFKDRRLLCASGGGEDKVRLEKNA